MADIVIEHLSKRYGDHQAVDDLSLEVEAGEFLTLLGPSGCGKTTTLRMIAGFITPDQGTITVGGETLSTPDGVVPPEKRRMGMVFQNYAIWPHKTVYENVAFGLEVMKIPKQETARRVGEMLALVGLDGLDRRYPSQLSGGQQQRVALARSLVVEPRILLLDEPLSNLDAKLRERMRWELKQLQRRTGITFVYVTHDQTEAMALSDRVVVMHLGKLQQVGTPREVYVRPANSVVADFMGLVNLVPGRVLEVSNGGGSGDGDTDGLVAVGERLRVKAGLPPGAVPGAEVTLAVRPESVQLLRPQSPPDPTLTMGRIEDAVFLGSFNDYQVAVDGLRLRVQAPAGDQFEVGEAVMLRLHGRCAAVQ
ncbi:MAG: ABC transporter ATP-binding protein [Chloroflexota bacterium]